MIYLIGHLSLSISATAVVDRGPEAAVAAAAGPAAEAGAGPGLVEVAAAGQDQGLVVRNDLALDLDPDLNQGPNPSQSPLKNQLKRIMRKIENFCKENLFCTSVHRSQFGHLIVYFVQELNLS